MIMKFKSGEVIEITNITYKYSAAEAGFASHDIYTANTKLESNVTDQIERLKASLTEENISEVTVVTYVNAVETEFKFSFTKLVSIESIITNTGEPVIKIELK